MTEQDLPWYHKWFNEDYLKLYSYRSAEEAEQQVNFVIDALKLKGDEKILDLGCGKGRHSLALATKGYKVLGIDISEYLIGEAEKNLKMDPFGRLRFQIGDMYHLEHLGIFDVVINMFTSFGYFEDDSENIKVFRIVREHLQSGGKFFLDYLHPAQVRKGLVPYEERDINGEKVIIRKAIKGNLIVKTIEFPGRTYEEKVKLYDRDQIESMLISSQFHIAKVWNDYQGNPWHEDGQRQLFYCQAVQA